MENPGNRQNLPRHIAVIMDGNGRWALRRGLPREVGHRAGVKALRKVVEYTARIGVEVLTVFAFSSENWSRPRREVELLMELFLTSLRNEVDDLHKNNIRLTLVGDRTGFPEKLSELISAAEARTSDNTGMIVVVAANYGGRWDIIQACRRIAEEVSSGNLVPSMIDEHLLHRYLAIPDLPEPDLFIRTGGEQRLSNFLLWHCAYSELYFCDLLWPDFAEQDLQNALVWFAKRQRRFGRTDEQIRQTEGA